MQGTLDLALHGCSMPAIQCIGQPLALWRYDNIRSSWVGLGAIR